MIDREKSQIIKVFKKALISNPSINANEKIKKHLDKSYKEIEKLRR